MCCWSMSKVILWLLSYLTFFTQNRVDHFLVWIPKQSVSQFRQEKGTKICQKKRKKIKYAHSTLFNFSVILQYTMCTSITVVFMSLFYCYYYITCGPVSCIYIKKDRRTKLINLHRFMRERKNIWMTDSFATGAISGSCKQNRCYSVNCKQNRCYTARIRQGRCYCTPGYQAR